MLVPAVLPHAADSLHYLLIFNTMNVSRKKTIVCTAPAASFNGMTVMVYRHSPYKLCQTGNFLLWDNVHSKIVAYGTFNRKKTLSDDVRDNPWMDLMDAIAQSTVSGMPYGK
jgi:hypothetical protein